MRGFFYVSGMNRNPAQKSIGCASNSQSCQGPLLVRISRFTGFHSQARRSCRAVWHLPRGPPARKKFNSQRAKYTCPMPGAKIQLSKVKDARKLWIGCAKLFARKE